MASKRKHSVLNLDRRVRAKLEDEWELEPQSAEASSDDTSSEGVNDDDGDRDSASEAASGMSSEPAESDADDDAPKIDLSSVSFGALARAQASLPPPARKPKPPRPDGTTTTTADRPETGPARGARRTEEKKPKPKRASKHAPQELSSKRPVSRRREILVDPRRKHRDPRFDPLVGRLDESKAGKAYAFLDDYRDSEMADLRAQIKKTGDDAAKERLKRQLKSMESKRLARQKKEEEDELLRQHRRQEKELVAQGKKPFYLKKSEQKKQLLTKRYESMSKGQVDKAIERKRKKVAGKEKKELYSLTRNNDRR